MHSHGNTSTNRSQSQWIDLTVDQILDAVPTHRPSETAEVDHHDGACGSTLLRRCLILGVVDVRVDDEENGHVEHGNELERDTSHEGTLAADEVDEEEGAEKGGDEFDDTEDGGL